MRLRALTRNISVLRKALGQDAGGQQFIETVPKRGYRFTASIRDHEIGTQFRFETFNVTNTPQFAAPVGAYTAQNFGQVTRQFNSPREFQFGLKIKF